MNAAELIADLQKENELRTKNARLSFEGFCRNGDVPLVDGIAPTTTVCRPRGAKSSGDEIETTIAEARYHDLVVLGRPAQATALSTNGIGAVLVGSGRPLLARSEDGARKTSRRRSPSPGRTGRKPRAPMSAAAPLLRRRRKIVVLTPMKIDGKCEQRGSHGGTHRGTFPPAWLDERSPACRAGRPLPARCRYWRPQPRPAPISWSWAAMATAAFASWCSAASPATF